MGNLETNKRKQEQAIKRAAVGQIYIKGKDGNVMFIDAFDMQVTKDMSLSQFIKDYEEKYTHIVYEFEALINSLKDAQFVFPDKQYVVVGLKNGYICNGNDYVIELDVEIEELYKGYCVIDNHVAVIDTQKKEEYLNTFKGGIL